MKDIDKDILSDISENIRELLVTEAGEEPLSEGFYEHISQETGDPRYEPQTQFSLPDYVGTALADSGLLGQYMEEEYDLGISPQISPDYLKREAERSFQEGKRNLSKQNMLAMINVYVALGEQYDKRLPEDMEHPALMSKKQRADLLIQYTSDILSEIRKEN